MDQKTERKCLDLVENYRILTSDKGWEFTEMILACGGEMQEAL